MPRLHELQLRLARHYANQLQTDEATLRTKDRKQIVHNLQCVGDRVEADNEAARIYHQLFAVSDVRLGLEWSCDDRARWINFGIAAAQRLRLPAFEAAYLHQLSTVSFTLGQYQRSVNLAEQANGLNFDLPALDQEAVWLMVGNDPYVGVTQFIGEAERSNAFYRLFELLHKKLGIAVEPALMSEEVNESATKLVALSAELATTPDAPRKETVGGIMALFYSASRQAAQGNYELAIRKYAQALRLSRRANDPRTPAVIQGILGWLYAATGGLSKSVAVLLEALQGCRNNQDQWGEYLALGSLGVTSWLEDKPQRALDYFRQALELTRVLGRADAEEMMLSHLNLCEENFARKMLNPLLRVRFI